MGKRRMKPIVKLIIILLIFGGLFLVYLKFKNVVAPQGRQVKSILTEKDKNLGNNNATDNNAVVDNSSDGNVPVIRIGVVTWGGYAGGQYFNEGFDASTNSRFYKSYGIKVEFKVLDDFTASRNAFKNNEIDLLWATIDAFASESDALKEYEPMFVMQADWSRGGDAIVANHDIQKVKDLKGKKIAFALGTPSHTFLLNMLQADDMEYNAVKIIPVDSAITAAQYFKQSKVDAAIVWSPDDADCVASVPGAHILKSTKEASYIIADGFFAKKAFIESHQKEICALYEGWMIGSAEINTDSNAKKKAIKILAEGLKISEEFAETSINNVRLTTHGDNINFFGMNSNYKGITGEQIYNKMAKLYNAIGLAPDVVPHWRQVNDTVAIRSVNLTGAMHNAEGQISFKVIEPKEEKELEKAPEITTKTFRIAFAFGSSELDENGRIIIDLGFADIAKQFANSRIRIIGHTDNIGDAQDNLALSKQRAQAIANYLVKKYGFDRNRFIVVGKGESVPIANNNTDAGRAKNRRVEIQLL